MRLGEAERMLVYAAAYMLECDRVLYDVLNIGARSANWIGDVDFCGPMRNEQRLKCSVVNAAN